MGCHLPHPMCHRPQAMRLCSPTAARRVACLAPVCPQGHPKTSCLLWGGPGYWGCRRSSPISQGPKLGFPKATLFLPRASSRRHPGTAPPPPARAGSAPTRRAGVTVAFPGGIAQVKEEGTAHNSGLCRTAVAPNFCQPFQTRVSQNQPRRGCPVFLSIPSTPAGHMPAVPTKPRAQLLGSQHSCPGIVLPPGATAQSGPQILWCRADVAADPRTPTTAEPCTRPGSPRA